MDGEMNQQRKNLENRAVVNDFVWRLKALYSICDGHKQRVEKAMTTFKNLSAEMKTPFLSSQIVPLSQAIMKQLAEHQKIVNEEFSKLTDVYKAMLHPKGLMQTLFRRRNGIDRLNEEIDHAEERAKRVIEACEAMTKGEHFELLAEMRNLSGLFNDILIECQDIAKKLKMTLGEKL